MTDTTFTDNDLSEANRVVAAWLNDANSATYRAQSGNTATGLANRKLIEKLSDIPSILDFGTKLGSTADFQLAVDSNTAFIVPKGIYNLTTVAVGVRGLKMVCHKEAVFNISGNGFYRNLLQTPRATFIAANGLLDATNYYFTMQIEGGTFNVAAGGIAISDRVPFLVDTGASPSQVLLQRSLLVKDATIVLSDATAVGIGIRGGWGAMIRGGSISAAGIDAVAINIGGSSADGDVSCHPQEILIDGVTFNSCRPFASAKNGCTNAAEGLTVRGSWFNFVRLAEINNVNNIRWVGANQFVTDVKSLDFVDCSDVTISESYFESNHDPANSAKPGIVNLQNCQDIKVLGNSFNVLVTSIATARDGILIKADATTAMRGIFLRDNRFQHAAYSAALETNAIRFATAGGSGQLLDVVCRDNICSEWHNAINFTDHITNLATGVEISGITNTGGMNFLKGVARIAPTGLRAPGLWEQFSLVLSGQSKGGGAASNVLADYWPTVMRSAAPVVTVTNFTNLAACNGITAAWATIGANTVHIVGAQTAASAAGDLVQGSATITINGTAV